MRALDAEEILISNMRLQCRAKGLDYTHRCYTYEGSLIYVNDITLCRTEFRLSRYLRILN